MPNGNSVTDWGKHATSMLSSWARNTEMHSWATNRLKNTKCDVYCDE